MKIRNRIISFLLLCVLVSLSIALTGCKNDSKSKSDKSSTKDHATTSVNTTVPTNGATKEPTEKSSKEQTEKTTKKPTTEKHKEQPTQEPTQAPTDTLDDSTPVSMIDFRGYTIAEILMIYGTQIEVGEYLYLGGAGSFWYTDNSAPYIFYYKNGVETMGTIPSASEKLLMISSDGDVYVDDLVHTTMNGSEVESLRPSGSWGEHVDSGYYAYTYEIHSCYINCLWKTTDTSGPMHSAEILFK